MSKSKPKTKTIADLQINWTFDWNIDNKILVKIQELNPETFNLKVVRNTYYFLIGDSKFKSEVFTPTCTLSDLIYHIDSQVFNLQENKKLSRVLVLDHFELIEENTFRIHVK